MTKYTFTFTTKNGTTTIEKEFATYMQASNFQCEYVAKHFDVYHSSMAQSKA